MGRLALPLGERDVLTVSVWEQFVLFCFGLLGFFWGGVWVTSSSLAKDPCVLIPLISCVAGPAPGKGAWPVTTHVTCPKHEECHHCFLHGECGTPVCKICQLDVKAMSYVWLQRVLVCDPGLHTLIHIYSGAIPPHAQ